MAAATWAYTLKRPVESPLTREVGEERTAARRGKRRLPPKTPDVEQPCFSSCLYVGKVGRLDTRRPGRGV